MNINLVEAKNMTKNYFVNVSVVVNKTQGFEIGFKTVDIDLVTEEEPITESNYASFKYRLEKLLIAQVSITFGDLISFQIKNISVL